MMHAYKWIRFGILPFLLLFSLQDQLFAQANIQVRVMSVQVLNTVDCDGFFGGDSDFVIEYIATDNTLGKSNNNPVLFGFLGNFNHAYQNGNNGPWTLNSPNGNINPNSGIFYNHDFVCPGDVPTNIRIDWQGYENDAPTNYDLTGGAFSEVRTGAQMGNIAVPATPGTNTMTFTASGTSGCGTQTYRITIQVTRTFLNINYWPDAICNAVQIPIGGGITNAWCPNATFEPNEPRQGDIAINGSVWFYFVAPASGRVDISTDHGATDFGTEIHIYHAADGIGCVQGFQPVSGVQIKNKFDYLSNVDRADLGGFLNLQGEADITFDDCSGVFSSNPLVAGEVYYVQMSTDDPGQRGYIRVTVSDLGGSPAEPWDIPCRSTDVTATAQSTTVRGFSGGANSANLGFGCSTSRETGAPHTSTNPSQYHAYDYNHNATNNGNMDESVWTSFIAPNSGRVVFEGNVTGVFGVNETENSALFGFDPRFGPGRPADFNCANLSYVNAAEGGTGFFGANPTAVIRQSCLEPGYRYYAMVDPMNGSTGSNATFWMYNPSVSDATNNAPDNDILCLAMANSFYEIPVQLVGQPPLPFQAVAGSNIRACIERLAGEPVSSPNPATRADQTVWHYFTAPPSGVVEIRMRAYTGLNRLNYAIYPLLNGTDCYGGLRPATYTTNGLQGGSSITPIAQGSATIAGTTVSFCCLVPGTRYAIQLDGGAPGDQGMYIIEYVNEIEVYAGDSQYATELNDTIRYNSNDTAFICFGDSIFPSTMLNPLGISTTRIPGCMALGYVMHNTLPIPDPIANIGFSFIDSVRFGNIAFVNNTNGTGTFSNPSFNQVYYVSALADEGSTWGQLTCPSASMENGAPVVFLTPVTLTSTYDPNRCIISFTPGGGLPAYNGSMYSYVITNTQGDTIRGQAILGDPVVFQIPVADIYTITVTDGVSCSQTIVVNAMTCLNPCIFNPVRITPRPIDSTVYTCMPGGDSAMVTVFFGGGYPAQDNSLYSVLVSGSSVPGANGAYTSTGAATPTPFSFMVMDGDTWQVILSDTSLCSDTTSHLFTYDLTNCPDFCTLNPLSASYNLNCFPNNSALIEITMSGGTPAIDASNYLVTTSGSTVFGQNFNNAQIPGTIGGSGFASMLVNNTDNWMAIVKDINGCADTLSGLFTTILVSNANYICNTDGTALVELIISGGVPSVSGSNYLITVTGSTVGGNIVNDPVAGVIGGSVTYTFLVNDGDSWQVNIEDGASCSPVTTGMFNWGASSCSNICTAPGYTPVQINGGTGNYSYDCDGSGNAMLTLEFTGGLPAMTANNSGFEATITINGVTITQLIAASNGRANLVLNLVDGDNWQVVLNDGLGCHYDTLGAVFTAVNAVAQTDIIFEVYVGQPATLIGTNSTGNISSYLWTPSAGIQNPTAATTTVMPIVTTVYTLEVRDQFDCSDMDSVKVKVGGCIPDHAGFTPNGDGTNETWHLPCLELLNGDVEVYNRWGQMVYMKESYDNSWNGTHYKSGQDLPDATYYYVIKVTYPNYPNPVYYKGTVTIIR